MSAPRMVMAIGDDGLEAVPACEVVEIQAIPVGPDNIIVPATVRALRRTPHEKVPTRILAVRGASTRRNARPFALVDFKCTPYQKYTLGGVPVMGDRCSCFVRHLADARDELWDGLSVADRRRIERAVANA